MKVPVSDKVAKIDNNFIVNAQYRMSAKEQKVLYYLIAHLDPKNQTEFHKIKIHFNDIREMLKEGDHHYGSFQADMYRLCKSLISKHIIFPANFFYEGKEWSGFINWFQTIKPIEEDGQSYVEFHFSEGMKPFLLQLHQYVNINPLEVVPMQNAHAIRMYSIFKSEKDKMKNVKNTVTLEYLLEELKAILGISDKYTGDNFKDFRVYVLDKIRNEINNKTPTMSVEYDYIKTARKVTGVAFNVREKQLQAPKPKKEPKPQADIKTYIPSEKELEILSKAKLQAYHILIGFGIFESIAYKQILPKVRGSEFEGYEDFFIEKAIQHFEKNAIQNTTKELKASTFVTWWTKNKVFESGDVWADILEKLAKHKKQLQVKTPVAFENRIIAKTMTNAQFDEYIKKNKA